ncbi:MAG: diguanylate cyclase [Desulfonatronovibrio sp.]
MNVFFRSRRPNRHRKNKISQIRNQDTSDENFSPDSNNKEVVRLKKKLRENIELYQQSLAAFHKFRDCCTMVQAIQDLKQIPDLLISLTRKLNIDAIRLVLCQEIYTDYIPSEIDTLANTDIQRIINTLQIKAGRKSASGKLIDLKNNIPDSSELLPVPQNDSSGGSAIIFPLQDKFSPEKTIGFLTLYDLDEKRFSGKIATDFIDHFAQIFAWSLAGLRDHEKLVRESTRDHLTGCHNRTYFTKHAPRIIDFAIRKNLSVALLFIDLDGFKKVNDKLGHQCGDLILVEVGRKIQSQVRNYDIFVRLGGDEFIILMPDTDQQTATVLADRIGREIQAIDISGICKNSTSLKISASTGIAMYSSGDCLDELIRRADQDMYLAKNSQK